MYTSNDRPSTSVGAWLVTVRVTKPCRASPVARLVFVRYVQWSPGARAGPFTVVVSAAAVAGGRTNRAARASQPRDRTVSNLWGRDSRYWFTATTRGRHCLAGWARSAAGR